MINQIKKNRRPILFTPGPLQLSRRVRRALFSPSAIHRGDKFSEFFVDLGQKLLRAFELNKDYFPCIFTATGRGANEAMIAPFILNKKPLFITNGSWGDNLIKIAGYYKKNILKLELPKDRRIDPLSVGLFLKKHKDIDTLIMVHQETRSGILNPLAGIAQIAKNRKLKLVVDAMSSVVVEKTDFQKLGVAFFSCGSTKGLRSAPGLCIVCGRIEEFEELEQGKHASHYLDLYEEYANQRYKKEPRFAQSTTLLVALNEAINELLEEGISERRRTIRKRTSDFRSWAKKNGLHVSFPESELGDTITTFDLPGGITYQSFFALMRNKGMFVLYGDGSGGNQFQVTFMGANSNQDIIFLKKAILGAIKI